VTSLTTGRERARHSGPTAPPQVLSPPGLTPGQPDTWAEGLLISIQPRYAEAILAGQKTVELRRRPPKCTPPIVVIYGSGHLKSVLGTATLDGVHTSTPDDIWNRFGSKAGVTREEFDVYFAGSSTASALVLTKVRVAQSRMPLAGLRQLGLEPPQSWRYVSSEHIREFCQVLHCDASKPQPIGLRVAGSLRRIARLFI
jgi:predicted transcriptional regulator